MIRKELSNILAKIAKAGGGVLPWRITSFDKTFCNSVMAMLVLLLCIICFLFLVGGWIKAEQDVCLFVRFLADPMGENEGTGHTGGSTECRTVLQT